MQLNQPSLPPWLSYYYSQDYKAGLLYGVPDTAGQTRLEVVATNRDTFETGTLHININTHKLKIIIHIFESSFICSKLFFSGP